MSAEQPKKKAARRGARWLDENFNKLVVAIIALVTVYAGLVAYLQTWADNGYSTAVREGQTLAMDALGNEMSSRQRENYDFSLYTTWSEWEERYSQAEGVDDAAAARAQDVMDLIAPLTPLLDESGAYFTPETLTQTYWANVDAYHVDTNLVETTRLLEKRAFAIERASVWNGKSDGYVTVLTVLAVALFLYGLSTTMKGGLRYVFGVAGTILISLAVAGTVNLTLRPIVTVPDEAIAAYAEGQGRMWTADYKGAVESFDRAVAAYPHYANALAARGKAHLRADDYEAAVVDFMQSIEHGRESVSTYWELGWAHYLLGDYEASMAASRRALELDPDLLPVVMNLATAQLASGDTEGAMFQYELALTMAADPNAAVPISWSHLYLRESINDLDRLLAALDGQTGFEDEPDLSRVADRAALRDAADAARQRLKEGLISLEVAGQPRMEPAGATLSPLTFARYVGRTGALVGQADIFARGELSIVDSLSFENLPQGAVVSRRVTRQWSDEPGTLEILPTMGQDLTWEGDPSGTWQHEMIAPWPGDRGLRDGRYVVEYYVNVQLMQSGSFLVPASDEPTIGPIAFGTACSSGGVPDVAAVVFPAGVVKLYSMVTYSGVSDGTVVWSNWYRDGALYSSWANTSLAGWGSQCFSLNNVPAGDYRLDLVVEGQTEPVQSASFRVLDIPAYLAAIGPEPDDSVFYLDLGDAYAYAGDVQNAAARYQQAIDRNLACDECYYRWWSLLYEQGDYQAAADKLQQAIALSPKEYTYLSDLGETYYQLGDEEAAVAAYRQAIPLNPAMVYNEWANTLYNLDRYEEAAAKYEQSLELNPDDEVVHANLGGVYRELERYDEAVAEFERALALDPTYATPYNKWGDTLYDQGRYAEAAEKYQKAMDLDPSAPLYASNLGWATYQLGEYEQAAAAFQQAVELDPSQASDWNKWGDALYALERYTEAAEKYEQAIELRPAVALYHSNLAWAYFMLDQFDAAEVAFGQAVDLQPDSATDWNMWGRCLYELQRYAEAAEKHEQAVVLVPDSALYHYNLGFDYYVLARDTEALAQFQQAADLAAQAGDEDLRQDAQNMIDQLQQ
jgi:tetratricopeptide (TPR) repeat protein